MQLKALQKKIPTADTLAGRVIAFHEGKHYDLGEYVGDGLVVLSRDAEKLLSPAKPVELKHKVKLDDTTIDDLDL
jgi:hypothetical protein